MTFQVFHDLYEPWRNLKKRLSIPIRHMFPCLVSIHRKMLIQRQPSCLNQDWSPSRGSGAMWIILFQKCLSLHSRSLNSICTVVIPGQILARQCSWRSIELSNRLQNPLIQSLRQEILIIPEFDGRKVKNHCKLRDHAHFSFFDSKPGSCLPICGIIITNKSFSFAKAVLVCSFHTSGKNPPSWM